MAAFPSVYQVIEDGYSVEGDDGSELSRADDGTLKIRRLYGATRYNITFRIAPLSAAQTQAVRQFYESYKTQTITWTDPYTSVVYDVLMTRQPRIVDMNTPWATMEVDMEGVPQ